MNITSAQYYTTFDTSTNEGIKSTIDGQETYVPLDTANRHYQAILEWVKIDGNTIEDAD
tara:strand:+ start:516 stop:692 length:177 start_codon:yes stop_codon:yes gene_type:complete